MIQKKNLNSFKIGVTNDPQKRLITLQTGNEHQLVMVCKFKTKFYSKMEKLFKNKYSIYKQLGEWYDTCITEKEFLSECVKFEKVFQEIETYEKQLKY